MKLLYIVSLLLISNTLYASKISIAVNGESRDKLDQQEKSTVSSLFIYKFEEIKQRAKQIRNNYQHKDLYNDLAKRVNSLIDSVVVCVKRESISQEEDKGFRRELHRILEEIEKINSEISKDENLKPYELAQSSFEGKTGFNIDINVDKILSWLTKTIASLDQFFDKRDFIGKLEDKKWEIINR